MTDEYIPATYGTATLYDSMTGQWREPRTQEELRVLEQMREHLEQSFITTPRKAVKASLQAPSKDIWNKR